MIKRKPKWIRILVGGAIASGLLCISLYGFVFTQNLSAQLAIPWNRFRQEILLIDWTCLFLLTFIVSVLIGLRLAPINPGKGIVGGGIVGLVFLLIDSLFGILSFGVAYYLICYLLWGWIFGLIVHRKPRLIIRQF